MLTLEQTSPIHGGQTSKTKTNLQDWILLLLQKGLIDGMEGANNMLKL